MLGLALFYVGAVLCLNGLWLLGCIGDNEIAVIDIFVGGITLLVSLYLAFGPGSDAGSIKAAALTLMFTFTYFWVAMNRYNGADGRGLGWFSLFVAITAVPVTIQTLSGATMEMRSSSGAKYLSLTCSINATSQTQLDELYRELSKHEMVKIVL